MCENRKISEKTILNQFPPKSILKHYGEMGCCDADPQSDSVAKIIKKCLTQYGINASLAEWDSLVKELNSMDVTYQLII